MKVIGRAISPLVNEERKKNDPMRRLTHPRDFDRDPETFKKHQYYEPAPGWQETEYGDLDKRMADIIERVF